MYIFVNTTEVDIKHVLRLYNSVMDGTFSGTGKFVDDSSIITLSIGSDRPEQTG